MPEKQENTEPSGSSLFGGAAANDGSASNYRIAQATEAMERLRGMIDQATQSLKELTQTGQQWAQTAPGRAQEMAQQMREQGGRAVGSMSETVAQNPLTSIAVAFAVGFLLASLIRR
jgi:ElaB/YqjD/DUF883 family membrane-anchored ribosome-binding protein